MSSYNCKSCSFSTTRLNALTSHVKVHRNVTNHRFVCGIPECPCTFEKFQSFKCHMYQHHGKAKKGPPVNKAQPQNVILSCQVKDCKFESTDFSRLCAHLKWHIKNGKNVICPYIGCAKYFQVRSTFSSHLTRTHKFSQPDTRSHTAPDSQQNEQCTLSVEMLPEAVFDVQDTEQNAVPDQGQFLNYLALFYLKMQAKMLLPASTIQKIIEEFQEVHSCGMKHVLSKVNEKLSLLNLQDSEISQILDGFKGRSH